MLLTFGQYHTLTATVKPVTYQQLTKETPFDDLVIRYYIAGLLAGGLIRRIEDQSVNATYYQLTELGHTCILEYEQQNPALIVKRVYP